MGTLPRFMEPAIMADGKVGGSKIFSSFSSIWTGRGPWCIINQGRPCLYREHAITRRVRAGSGSERECRMPDSIHRDPGDESSAGPQRRRSPQGARRPKSIRVSLSEAEHAEVLAAASRAGLAQGAFAAEAVLAARGE